MSKKHQNKRPCDYPGCSSVEAKRVDPAEYDLTYGSDPSPLPWLQHVLAWLRRVLRK